MSFYISLFVDDLVLRKCCPIINYMFMFFLTETVNIDCIKRLCITVHKISQSESYYGLCWNN